MVRKTVPKFGFPFARDAIGAFSLKMVPISKMVPKGHCFDPLFFLSLTQIKISSWYMTMTKILQPVLAKQQFYFSS